MDFCVCGLNWTVTVFDLWFWSLILCTKFCQARIFISMSWNRWKMVVLRSLSKNSIGFQNERGFLT